MNDFATPTPATTPPQPPAVPPAAPLSSPAPLSTGPGATTSNPATPFASDPADTTLPSAAGTEPDKDEKPLNSRIAGIIEKIISHIPDTKEPTSNDPEARSLHIITRASTTAALVSGGLAIPPGPLGLATLVPDLYAIWKIQSQMVADIASAYGRSADLKREHMLYCLFRHITSQVARDVAVRVGQRILIRPGSVAIMNRIFSLIGREMTQRIVARGASRWVPLFGAAAVGAYAWYDTRYVGRTAVALFRPYVPPASPDSVKAEPLVDPEAPAIEELTAAGPSPSQAQAASSTPLHPGPTPEEAEALDMAGFVDLPPLPASPSPSEPPPPPGGGTIPPS